MTDVAALIDAAWYRRQYPDIAAAAIDPVEHYLRQGWVERRQPNWYFDPTRYGEAAGNPLLQYLAGGEQAGSAPSRHFDPVWYRAQYRISADDNCLAHYLGHRGDGSVSPSAAFDGAYYLAINADVAALGLDAFEHYVTTGRAEGRLPMPEAALLDNAGLFDENYYLLNAADVLDAQVDALTHFCAQGFSENRNPNPYFDIAWYAQAYPQRCHRNPLTDYIQDGEAMGRRPGPLFDPAWYAGSYGLDEHESPLRHWLQHRRSQKFSPRADFDVAAYVAANGGRLRPNRDPFMHALVTAAIKA